MSGLESSVLRGTMGDGTGKGGLVLIIESLGYQVEEF